MILYRILCEDLEECNQDPEFKKIIEIIDSCHKQGMLDLGKGYCSTTSLVIQSVLHLNNIQTEIIEVAATIEDNDSNKCFLGYDHLYNESQVPSHVVLVTKTKTPYLLDLSIGHILNGEIGIISKLNANLHINTDVLAQFDFKKYKFLYRQKLTNKFSQVYETSILNRINTDKKIFNDIQILKYLNYTAIALSLFSVINFITRFFL